MTLSADNTTEFLFILVCLLVTLIVLILILIGLEAARFFSPSHSGKRSNQAQDDSNLVLRMMSSRLSELKSVVLDLRCVVSRLQEQPAKRRNTGVINTLPADLPPDEGKDPLLLSDAEGQPSKIPAQPRSDVGESDDPIQQLCEAFTQGPDIVRQKYDVEQIDVTNVADLKADPAAVPRFGKEGTGDLWLIHIGDDQFVIPKPGKVLNQDHFRLGGLRKLFECDGYKPAFRFQKVILLKPARVVKTPSGTWVTGAQGRLRLEEGEPD